MKLFEVELLIVFSRDDMESCGLNSISSCSGSGSSSAANCQLNSRARQQRKQRRCWSPELHRRFINALQQLGDEQVATPKQIRDLMQVDGLTNDEVKSHLRSEIMSNEVTRGGAESDILFQIQIRNPPCR